MIDHVVYGQIWQIATESLAASGLLVLFGGMLLTSAAIPSRWRRLPEPEPARPGQHLPPSDVLAQPDGFPA